MSLRALGVEVAEERKGEEKSYFLRGSRTLDFFVLRPPEPERKPARQLDESPRNLFYFSRVKSSLDFFCPKQNPSKRFSTAVFLFFSLVVRLLPRLTLLSRRHFSKEFCPTDQMRVLLLNHFQAHFRFLLYDPHTHYIYFLFSKTWQWSAGGSLSAYTWLLHPSASAWLARVARRWPKFFLFWQVLRSHMFNLKNLLSLWFFLNFFPIFFK